ncbi:MAG TPA: SsrA-binding protein SmpB [Anaerolineales bacterium]|nr:SsrA-binding protein SmpB [Anaerolineales bacterium]
MDEKVIATNRKAFHDYLILERFEAGLVLLGSEIKSIRGGQISIKEAYVQVSNGEAWLVNAHIAPYNPSSRQNHDPVRRRKLLLKRKEIRELSESLRQKGLTVVPLRVLLRDGLAKADLALVRGKRNYDKRQAMAKRDADREVQRELGRSRKEGR